MYSESILKRFWNKVKVGSPDECWEWQAYSDSDGYGRFGIGRQVYQAHRISFEICIGPIPLGRNILHRCNNPSCVNPTHLYDGTQKDNRADSVRAGTAYTPYVFGESHPLSKLITKDILEIRSLHSTGHHSLRELGKIFGVDNKTIHKIIHRIAWKHVP